MNINNIDDTRLLKDRGLRYVIAHLRTGYILTTHSNYADAKNFVKSVNGEGYAVYLLDVNREEEVPSNISFLSQQRGSLHASAPKSA